MPALSSGETGFVLRPVESVAAGQSLRVSFGVPFPEGFVPFDDLSRLRVLDAAGNPKALNVRALTPWRDLGTLTDTNSLRAALVQMDVAFPDADGDGDADPLSLRLEWGRNARTLADLSPSDPRAGWVQVVDDQFTAAHNVLEPPAYAVFTPDWYGNALIKSRLNPADAAMELGGADAAGNYAGYEYDSTFANFGDTAVNDVDPRVTEANKVHYTTDYEPWLFDRAMTLYQLAFKTNNADSQFRYLREAHRASQFYANHIDASGHFDLRPGDMKYVYGESISADYWLTGDPRLVQVHQRMINAFDGFDASYQPGDFWTERHAAFKLLGYTTGFELLGTAAVGQKARDTFTAYVNHQNTPPAGAPNTGMLMHRSTDHGEGGTEWIGSPWMSVLLVDAVQRYYAHSDDSRVPAFVQRMADGIGVIGSGLYADSFNGSTRLMPFYLAGPNLTAGQHMQDAFADVEHAVDVSKIFALAYYFSKQEQDPPSQTALYLDRFTQLSRSAEASFAYWTRPGGPASGLPVYRLTPPRKFNWWFRTTADADWLLEADAAPASPSFQFASGSYSVNEGAGTLTITVTRSGDSSAAASVNYATSNGTGTNAAVAGSDYTAASGTLSFAAGETSRTFTVSILNDAAVENAESFNLALSNPTGGATLGSLSASVVTIADNDTPPDTTAPVISGVSASGISSGGATIAWTTNEAADTQVQYGATTSYGSSSTLNASLSTGHSVALSGLSPSTTYHYRVLSRDAAGNLATSADFSFTTTAASTGALGLSIPTSHARLWFTPERLAAARQRYAANPFTPSSSDPLANALRYQMTGEASYARVAIGHLMNFTISQAQLDAVSTDVYRWSDWVPVVFDWCYDQMTADERQTFTDRYNHYVDVIRQKDWGGVGMEANNYYWGYLRNEFNWAVASWHENPMAATFLNHALVTRWQDSFLPYAQTYGQGGVPHEGSSYGSVMLSYPLTPLVSAELMGRDLMEETDFYKEAAYYLLYTTTPSPTYGQGTNPYYQQFAFNDEELDGGFPGVSSRTYYGDFMTVMAQKYAGSPLGQYARQWLSRVAAPVSRQVSLSDPGGTSRSYAELPTDYYAPGPGYFYVKDDWNADATSLLFQLGAAQGVGHEHMDAGSFQIARKGRWISKESTGYSQNIVAYGGAVADVYVPSAHNTVLVNGRGQIRGWGNAPPVVRRVESQADYAYAAVDLTASYRSSQQPSLDNPQAGNVVREFVYVRALDTLLVFDRLQSSDPNAAKTFLLHFQNQPTVSGNTVSGVVGDQALRMTTLNPAGQTPAAYRVINERPASPSNNMAYQYRVEAETSGQAQSYLINVIQAKDATGAGSADVTATMTEDATHFIITLTHPTLGTSVIRMAKGMPAGGNAQGSFGYAPSGTPTLNPIANSVQGIEADENGVRWLDEEPPDTTAPLIRAVSASNTMMETATIGWTTNEPADAMVEYGTTIAYGSASALRPSLLTTHNLALSGLSPGTTYYYRVLSRDAAGNLRVSGNYTFTTESSALRISGGADDDSIYVRLSPGGNLIQIWHNQDPQSDPPEWEITRSVLTALDIRTLGGDDIVTIDLANGYPLPSSVNIDGGAGTADVLRIIGSAGPDVLRLDTAKLTTGAYNAGLGAMEHGVVSTMGGDDSVTVISQPFGTSDMNLGSGSNVLDVTAGELTLQSDLSSTGSSVFVTVRDGARLNFGAVQHLAALSLFGNARAVVGGNGSGLLSLRSLAMSPDATLDLGNNDLIIRTASDAEARARVSIIRAWLARGRNGGAWNGTGITSSAARQDLSGLTGLHLLRNQRANGSMVHSHYAGEDLDRNVLIIKYTWMGDADVSGSIDADDYYVIDRAFLSRTDTFPSADFNFDGVITLDDYLLIDSSYLGGGDVL